MAMERLVETILTPNNMYIQLQAEDTKILSESFSRFGRLTERTESKVSTEVLIKDLESLRLQESVNSDILDRVLKNLKEANISTSDRKYYKFPIGRYGNMNANNRVYTRELWENVVNNQQEAWKGLCGLSDHPEGDSPGFFRDSSIVWLDMEIDDNGLVYGIGTFVGPYGHLAQEIVDCGGRVGFSSSGFGEVRTDRVVDPSTYQIERVADIVLNPSQSVFGDNSAMNIEYNRASPIVGTGEGTMSSSLHESTPRSQIVKERNMGNVVDAVSDGMSPGLSKIEEKTFIKYVNNFLKDAEGIKNPSDRLKELADILTTFEEGTAPELRKVVETSLIQERTKLEEMIQDTVEFKEEFGIESLKEFADNAKSLAMEATFLNEENVNYKELCENLISHNKELKQTNTKLALKLKLKENKVERATTEKNEISVYADSKTDEYSKKLSEARSSIIALKSENKDLSAGNNDLEKVNENLKSRLSTALTERDEVTADMRLAAAEIKSLREAKANATQETKKILEVRKELSTRVKALTESLGTNKNKIAKLTENLNRLTAENAQLSNMVSKVQLQEAKSRAEASASKRSFDALKEKVELDNTPDAHVIPRFEDRVSGHINLREDKGAGIESYWADLVSRYGESIEPYERHIRGAKTLREAQAAYYRNMKYIDNDVRAADDARVSSAVRPSDRKHMVEAAGFKDEREDTGSIDRVNQRFMESMPKDFR